MDEETVEANETEAGNENFKNPLAESQTKLFDEE